MEITQDSFSWQQFRSEIKQQGFAAVCLKSLIGWARQNAITAMPLDLGCCSQGIFLESASAGVQLTNVENPRHADVLIVSGALSNKMAPVLRRIYDQMPDPKSVVSIGSCANGGGLFADSYAVVSSISNIVPVDVFIPGCPPSADSFLAGMELLQKRIFEKTLRGGQ